MKIKVTSIPVELEKAIAKEYEKEQKAKEKARKNRVVNYEGTNPMK